MSKYLLDNSVLIAYLKGRPGALSLIRPWIAAQEVVTSQIVYAEAIEYIKGDADYPVRQKELRVLMREISPHRLTYAILERYADLRRAMRPPYGPGLIGDMDTLIAATAMEHGLMVVTLDSDYMRVPGLLVMRLERRDLL